MHYWLTGTQLPLHDFHDDSAFENNDQMVSKVNLHQRSYTYFLKEYRDTLNSSTFRNTDKIIWALWENLVLRSVYVYNNQVTGFRHVWFVALYRSYKHSYYYSLQDSIVQKNMQSLISDLLQSISVEWIPVDYRHSETGE